MRCIVPTLWVLALLLGTGLNLFAEESESDLVKQTLNAWQKRRTAMTSVIYKVEGVEIYPKGSMTAKSPDSHPKVRNNYPPKDVSLPRQLDYTFDFVRGRIRKELLCHTLSHRMGEFLPTKSVYLFDGKDAKTYMPRAANTSPLYTPVGAQPELLLYKGGTIFILEQGDYPLLYAHGCPPFYNQDIDAAGYFDRPIDPSRLRFHQWGTIGDRRCVILRTIPEAGRLGIFDEFWIDLVRDGAILRWQAHKRGQEYIHYEVSYRQIDGHWLPQSWQFDLFPVQQGRREFINGKRMKVTDIQINPSPVPATFSVPVKHGMVVSDTVGGVFSVASDDQSLVPYGQSTYVWRWWHWLGLILLSVALLTGFRFWYRHRLPTGP